MIGQVHTCTSDSLLVHTRARIVSIKLNKNEILNLYGSKGKTKYK